MQLFNLLFKIIENVWVNTTNGQIKGRVQKTVAGTIFHTFSGIPFAEPPINELRFQVYNSVNNIIRILHIRYVIIVILELT